MLATGSTPRRLPDQPDLDGVLMLRTLDDALALRARVERGSPQVVVIGAGFIGAEVAATCRGRGLDVTVLEALPQPMVRGLGPELGAVIADMHRDHGVDLRTGVQVEAIEGDGRVERVRLADGSTIDADVVVVGVGVVPETGWLESSGLKLDNGVVCDETCLAAPGVVAAGDITRWPNPLFDGELMRLEHWTNATEQGVHGARRLLAGDATVSRSRRCRSCGPTSTTARSRPSDACRPTPTCTSRTAPTPSGSSSRCSAATAGSSARSASTGPAR